MAGIAIVSGRLDKVEDYTSTTGNVHAVVWLECGGGQTYRSFVFGSEEKLIERCRSLIGREVIARGVLKSEKSTNREYTNMDFSIQSIQALAIPAPAAAPAAAPAPAQPPAQPLAQKPPPKAEPVEDNFEDDIPF